MRLNPAQQQAVDAIDGPVLVIAGPGTGKTQLLSLRVANIIKQTDTAPGNILCLTFTDNAARNMRERLETIIGQSAFHVSINTFHSFGADIIGQYADYFTDRALLQQIDELGRYQLLRQIFEELPHGNPLTVKTGDNYVHLKDTLSTISWLKQNALSPKELEQILKQNQQFMTAMTPKLAETFVATPSPKLLAKYEQFLALVKMQIKGHDMFGFPEYARLCAAELESAIQDTPANGRYAKPITAWRKAWCQKDAKGDYVFKDSGNAFRKLQAVAEVYKNMIERLAEQGLYDFDDMIVEVVHAMEQNDELRLNLQERYQYILVDEFQDTNKAQLRMLTALGNNPVYEGRPNIMAVGDDDQAIYAFQGAEVSNMVQFARQYRDPTIITLDSNYRSTEDILQASFNVAGQINDRLENTLTGNHVKLQANAKHDNKLLKHSLFPSELAQYEWIAEQIEQYIKKDLQPQEIAVIAPRHRYLERLMPYLGRKQLPVAYERRENVLEAPLIKQLLSMSALVVAIQENQQELVDQLLGEVLGFEFWQIEDADLVKLSLNAYNSHKAWLELTTKHKNDTIKQIANWFVKLARRSTTEPLEYMLDHMLGGLLDGTDNEFDSLDEPVKQQGDYVSPMREFYFNDTRYQTATDDYLSLLGQLSTLRQHLRQWTPNKTLYIKDLVQFDELNRQAGVQIIDTNPHTQSTNAVQVMTAYKAKGLEFSVVFVINAQDEVWGPTTRSRGSNISLPKNLPLAPAREGDNDKLRLLFVAMTRAKHDLQITSYSHSLDNKLSPGLSFLNQINALKPIVLNKPAPVEASAILATDWIYRFRQVIADKATLFEPILANYKLSVTHFNNFIDVQSSGPQYFLLHNLLRFPEAPTPAAAYGDAVHKTLQWLHLELRNNDQLPSLKQAQTYFVDILARKHLQKSDWQRMQERGKQALALFLKERSSEFVATDLVERGFNNEGVVIAGAKLSGKIDKLHIESPGRAVVIDFKTGKPASAWQGKDEFEKIKLHKYRQQLLFYKLLVEGSATFSRRLTVTSGELEFVEPNDQGVLLPNLVVEFEAEELARISKLIDAVWQHIMALSFPDISHYPKNYRGLLQFEQDLMDDKI